MHLPYRTKWSLGRAASTTAVAALLATSCGQGAEVDTAASSPTTSAAPQSSAPVASDTTVTARSDNEASDRHPLPDVNVLDVATGSEVNLTTIGGDKPILLWFWAPH